MQGQGEHVLRRWRRLPEAPARCVVVRRSSTARIRWESSRSNEAFPRPAASPSPVALSQDSLSVHNAKKRARLFRRRQRRQRARLRRREIARRQVQGRGPRARVLHVDADSGHAAHRERDEPWRMGDVEMQSAGGERGRQRRLAALAADETPVARRNGRRVRRKHAALCHARHEELVTIVFEM